MKPQNVLLKYEKLSEGYQLNVSSFKDMGNELIKSCPAKKTLIGKIRDTYLRMRDGCEINSETFKYAIPEFKACLN